MRTGIIPILATSGALLLGALAWVWPGSNRIICFRDANESAAQATLRNIARAQRSFQESCAVDRNGNGVGEYGTLAELAGSTLLRGKSENLDPPVLSRALGSMRAGVVVRSGYVFQMWLPSDDSGGFVAEATEGGSRSAQIDDDASEAAWRCYAWPLEIDDRVRKVFVVDQEGQVMESRNERGFEGTWRRPPVDTAAGEGPWSLVERGEARNGVVWIYAG